MTSSHVVDYLYQTAPSPAYVVTFVYFDYQKADPQPAQTLIVSLLRQIVGQYWPNLPSAHKLWFQKVIKAHSLDFADLEENFLSLLSHMERCYIAVDALDESGLANDRAELLTLLKKLAGIPSARLFVTSRTGITDIQLAFEDAEEVRVEADEHDLRICLETLIDRSSSRQWIKTSDRESVVNSIIQRSHGMLVLSKVETASSQFD